MFYALWNDFPLLYYELIYNSNENDLKQSLKY